MNKHIEQFEKETLTKHGDNNFWHHYRCWLELKIEQLVKDNEKLKKFVVLSRQESKRKEEKIKILKEVLHKKLNNI